MNQQKDEINIGLVTDIHYADKTTSINRYYKQSLFKLEEAVKVFNDSNIDFMILLGDTIDTVDKETDLVHLVEVSQKLYKFSRGKYGIPGNHCLDSLTKNEFLHNFKGIENNKSHFTLDKEKYEFIFLDANFRQDGIEYSEGNFKWQDSYLPPTRCQWLEQKLKQSAAENIIIFIHQLLDDSDSAEGVKNGDKVRKILEKSNKVVAVFQGHRHDGGYSKINDIHYVTMPALVEGDYKNDRNNAFAKIKINDGKIKIEGFGRVKSRVLELE
ncbi:MAG: metallophosphoesterase [Bacillota bacterium]